MSADPTRTFHCEPFPPLTIESDSGYWSGTLTIGGQELPMSLYVDAGLSDGVLKDAATVLGDILTLEKRGRSAIAKEAEIDETIMRDFFLFHLEEVPDCLSETVRTEATKEAFVEALKLVGVAIHEDDKAAFQLVLDYGYGRDYSDQLLAVKFGPDRVIWEVSHES